MPSDRLWKEFKKAHDLYMDEFIDEPEEKMLDNIKKEVLSEERHAIEEIPISELADKAMIMLPEILNPIKVLGDSDHGRLFTTKMRQLFEEKHSLKIGNNKSQYIKGIVCERLHADNDRLLKMYCQELIKKSTEPKLMLGWLNRFIYSIYIYHI